MSCKSLKFNGVELSDFTDTQLKQLCLKHQIITTSEAHSMSKEQLLNEIKSYIRVEFMNGVPTKNDLQMININLETAR